MLILASSSPRRKQLLALGGWHFSVMSASVDESVLDGELPARYVCRLAEMKAQAVLSSLLSNTSPEDLIIGADTAVVDWVHGDISGKNFTILGKPSNAAEAETMLRRLRGRAHQVVTALAVLQVGDGGMITDACFTDVPMRDYSDAEMNAYIASGDPLDKAGAYAIQHSGFRPVKGIEGCYANVMGLPLCHLTRMLAKFGVHPVNTIPGACQRELDFTCLVHQRILELEEKELNRGCQ